MLKVVAYTLCIIVFIYMTYKNILMIRDNKKTRNYTKLYREMLAKEKDVYQKTQESIAKEKEPIMVSRYACLALSMEMEKGMEYRPTLHQIDLKRMFYYNGKMNQQSISGYTDTFLWLSCALAHAHRNKDKKAMDAVMSLFDNIKDELQDRLEYKYLEAEYNAFTGKGDHSLIDDMIEENYGSLKHDKNFVTTYKRCAEVIKDGIGEEINFDISDSIGEFAKLSIGEYFLKAVGNYSKYEPEEFEKPDIVLAAKAAEKKKKKLIKKKEEKK